METEPSKQESTGRPVESIEEEGGDGITKSLKLEDQTPEESDRVLGDLSLFFSDNVSKTLAD